MALGQKYQINKHDRHDIAWTTKIYEEGYTGAITYFVAADAEPAQINDCNESDDPIDPIKDKRFYLNVFSTSMFGLADFYSAEEMVLWAEVYQGLSLYMAGWVDPGEYEEAYGPAPYIARICIVDGLSILPKIKYTPSGGTLYDDYRLESDIIRTILGKIGFTSFREYVNVYETNMDNGVGDSPLDQCKLNVDNFADMYCDEVLREILKSYGACIRQQGGVFNIYRPRELTGTTVYGRYFTGATTKTAISFTAAQYIQRTGYATTYHQMPGSRIMIQRPAKEVKIKQDYGKKQSWLDNWDFKAETFASGTFTNWIRDATLIVGPISSLIRTDDEGFYIDNASSGSGGFRQAFGYNVDISPVDTFFVEMQYRVMNPNASAIASLQITFRVYSSASFEHMYLIDGQTCGFSATPSYINIVLTDVEPGVTDWQTWRREVPTGLPDTGPYWIEFFKGTESVYPCIKDVKIGVVSDSIAILPKTTRVVSDRRQSPSTMMRSIRTATYKIEERVGREYTSVNAINGEEIVYDCMLGDVTDVSVTNIIEQFAGTKTVVSSGIEDAAADFVTNHAADYVAGGVVVTSNGGKIIFTAAVAGIDFTGATTIVNVTLYLTGAVTNVTANSSGTPQIETILLSGDSGSISIWHDGIEYPISYVTSLTATAAAFVTNYAADFVSLDIAVTSSGENIIFTEISPVGGFNAPTIEATSPNLTGTVYHTQASTAAVARVDEVELSGGVGTANVTCDGVTELVESTETLIPSSEWSTRGGSEATELLQLVCDEIKMMRSRPRQFVDMIIQEQTKAATNLNLLGNFQDIINIFGTNMRAFIVNRGTFNIKSRTWKLDLIEIGEGDAISESTTADSTDVTADNNIITVDSN